MKKAYDFSNAEQGKFYRPLEELDIPIYLDQEIRDYLLQSSKSSKNGLSLNEVVNRLLKKDIEISRQLLG
jgi:hypothetical protein